MTREEFKERWEGDAEGGGITFDEIAACARAWGLCASPKTRPMLVIAGDVLLAAGCEPWFVMDEDDNQEAHQ